MPKYILPVPVHNRSRRMAAVIRKQLGPWLTVLGLLGLYWLGTSYTRLPWLFPLLLLAVFLAARAWELPGGVAAALASVLLWGLSLWQVRGLELLQDHWLVAGYASAGLAIIMAGAALGFLERQQRGSCDLANQLSQSADRLKLVQRIALSLSSTRDINQLLELVLDQLGQIWPEDGAAVLLADERKRDLVVTAVRGSILRPGTRVSSRSICGEVYRTGRPLCVSDVTKEKRYALGLEGTRSELAVPLVWDRQVVGVLNMESRRPNAYNQADVNLLTTVAEQAASAIGNARLYQQTQRLVVTDAQTGLYNYRHFQDRLALVLREAQLTGQPFALIMMDLDHFKQCNDTYGHPTGDAVLRQTAAILQESCRHEDLIFRYGGDEFAILLPNSSGEAAMKVGERIREQLSNFPFTTRSGRPLDVPLTVSLGVASYPRDGITAVDIVLAADKALYAAKNAGRNRVDSASAPAVL